MNPVDSGISFVKFLRGLVIALVILFLLALFVALLCLGCAGNEKHNNNQTSTNLKFDDPWMQRIWDKSREVNNSYREVDRARKNVVKLEDTIRLLQTGNNLERQDALKLHQAEQDIQRAKQNLADAEGNAARLRQEFDKLCNEHKEELLHKTKQ